MRFSPIAAALAVALASAGSSAQAGSVTVLQTQGAMATKVSQNGEYVVTYLSGGGGMRWTAATGAEDILPDFVYANGINNLGTVSGATSTDGGAGNGGHDLPALAPVGSPVVSLPIPVGFDSVDVYDVADDGTAVGLASFEDFTDAKAYYYSPVDGLVDLPVDNTTAPSRANMISADGHVVGGWSDDPVNGDRRAVVWVDRVATYVLDDAGNALPETNGVSGNGQWAVGTGWRMNVQNGQVDIIPGLPFAFGVSDDGKTIVGATGFFDTPPRALMIWTEANGPQLLVDYLAERAIALPPELPLQGGLTGISGDGSKIAGWTYGATDVVSIVIDGANAPIDHLFADGFDPPPPPPVVGDGGFEETETDFGPNPYWNGLDGNPGSGGATNFASNVPTHGGAYAIWFGGWGGDDQETQTASQTVTMPATGPRYLNYWRFAPALPDLAGTLTISIDGTPVETTDLSTIAPDELYGLHSIDVSSYADGGSHTILLQYDYPGGGISDGAIFIDDVSIDPTSTPERPAIGNHLSNARVQKLHKKARR